jgi:hypothetical protein
MFSPPFKHIFSIHIKKFYADLNIDLFYLVYKGLGLTKQYFRKIILNLNFLF